MKKIPKLVWAIGGCSIAGFIGAFAGHLVYGLTAKPDGYLYMDHDTKGLYAQLTKDPDSYKKDSLLIFKYNK